MLYAQHANRVIVSHDMRLVAALSQAAARFDHEDGNLYRLLVDRAAGGQKVDIQRRAAAIKANLATISANLAVLRSSLPVAEQARAAQVLTQIKAYGETIDVVATMLDIDFSASAAMLAPFRGNADQVIADVNRLVAAGVTDAQHHAATAAARTAWLVGLVAGLLLMLAGLAIVWMLLASSRGYQLQSEMRRRSEAEQHALRLARHDPLTNLANRREFVRELGERIDATVPFGVALVDLDDFKLINDIHGHAAGDAVLCALSRRMEAVVGKDAVLARLGGDEFAVILPGCHSTTTAEPVGEALCDVLALPVEWQNIELRLSGSIGIGLFPQHAVAVDTLLHTADVAMYQAKTTQKGVFQIFDDGMERARVERRRLADELRIGIATGQVIPFYQPIFQLANKKLCGYEVLARWRHPRQGLLAPDQFIPVAEASRQMNTLTDSLLRQVCSDLAYLPLHAVVAINVSPGQLMDPGLSDRLLAIIAEAGLPASRFEIEVTEAAIMDTSPEVSHNLTAFRERGASVALDDFGTGYSSLSNLRQLQFDRLKIDRSFVQGLTSNLEDQKLVEAMLSLANSFDMAVTAEGIETEEAFNQLVAMGCSRGQGFHLGKPEPLECLTNLPVNSDAIACEGLLYA
jgi:diguanylate cyclase (GGDEF)-like protein